MSSSVASRTMASLTAQVESYLSHPSKPKPLHLLYTSTPLWPFRTEQANASTTQTDIGVLDSSFNPPQRAHYGLATLCIPDLRDQDQIAKERFDAVLLLFSVRNADKGTGTSKDASTIQRLEMMKLMAFDLEREESANVAVGIVEDPLMVSKSTLIHQFIAGKRAASKFEQAEQSIKPAPVRLHWLVGFDTLERFFQVKYYPSPAFFANACQTFFEQERTTFICARRGIDSLPNKQQDSSDTAAEAAAKEKENEEKILASAEVKPWLDRGSIVMVDLDPSLRSVSSTAIRKTITDPSLSPDEVQARLHQMTTPSVAKHLMEEDVYRKE